MSIGGKEIKYSMMRDLGATDTTSEAYIADAFLRNSPVAPFMISLGDANAATVLAETPLFRVPVVCRLVSVYVTLGINLTAHDTNYKTILVYKRTAGGATTTLASQTTKITGGSGNITAFVPFALTNGSDLQLAAGDTISIEVTKANAGVASGAAVYAAGNISSVSVQLERVYAAS